MPHDASKGMPFLYFPANCADDEKKRLILQHFSAFGSVSMPVKLGKVFHDKVLKLWSADMVEAGCKDQKFPPGSPNSCQLSVCKFMMYFMIH